MILAIAFALGWIGSWSYSEAKRALDKTQHKKEVDFLTEEVKRLRIFMADNVGRGPYG
jgi:hypothetical protein